MNITDQQTEHPALTNRSNNLHHKRYDLSDRGLVHGYTEMVTDRTRDGWSCSLLTFLFPKLPGSRPAVIDLMKDEIQGFYSTLVTRTHRKPRTASPDELPLLIAVADLPVYKRDKTSSPMVLCNGGLHFHGLLLVPAVSRLNEPVEEHIRIRRNLYLRGLADLHVRPVTHGYDSVVDYAFKTVLRGRVSYDEGTLLLPRSVREVESA
jgi:hypothetical protein